MERLSDILRYIKPNHALSSALICQRAQEIIGDRGKVISLKNGVLVISVIDNYQAAAIAQDNIDVIERINKRLGQILVKRLRFKIQSD